jgi:hypothetical protein
MKLFVALQAKMANLERSSIVLSLSLQIVFLGQGILTEREAQYR